MARRPGRRAGAGRQVMTLADRLRDPGDPLAALVDCLNTNCFVADSQLTLVFMNRKAAAALVPLAGALRAAFGLQPADLIGTSIHRFHRDPVRIDRLLADPSALPREAEFGFGGRTIKTLISAVNTPTGERAGYVVLWEDVTQRTEDYAAFDSAVRTLNDVTGTLVQAASSGSDYATAVADASHQLGLSVSAIASATEEAAGQVNEAVGAAALGLSTLQELQQASSEIGGFLRLITGVAEQTKLLALNATIEAARAGTAGKGFAVVADEVKQLAGTTAASISDIEARIAGIQRGADQGADALQAIDQLVNQIRESQMTIAGATNQQSSVTVEIAQAVGQIASDIERTKQDADRITAAVAEVGHRTSRIREVHP